MGLSEIKFITMKKMSRFLWLLFGIFTLANSSAVCSSPLHV